MSPNPNPTEYTVESSTIIISGIPTRTGYDFTGWSVTSIPQGSTGSKTVVALWQPTVYNISYGLSGGTNAANNPKTYTIESSTITFAAPSRVGYTFVRWDVPSIPRGSTGDITVTAIWSEPIVYQITYDLAGGTLNPNPNPTEYTVETPTVRITGIPNRTGYDFAGWNVTSIPQGSTGKKAITAIWSDPIVYPITYDLAGGTLNPNPNPSTYTVESTTIRISGTPTRTGYDFTGWTITSIPQGSTGAVTVTATWSDPIVYQITYDLAGGTLDPNPNPTEYTVESPTIQIVRTPTRAGYDFAGWSVTSIPQGSTGAVNIVATWTPRNDVLYTVKHYWQNIEDDGYSLFETQALQGTADTYVTPSVKTYPGFRSPNTETVIINPDGSRILNYYYTRNSYKVTIISNGGTTIAPITQKYQSEWSIPTPERTHSTFGGWFKDANLSVPFTDTLVDVGDLTLYAAWAGENKPTDFTYSGFGSITVSAYVGTSNTMWIPAYINNVPVTTVSESAFRDQTGLTKIVVPETVTEIGDGAFRGCTSLVDLTLPFVGATIDTASIPSWDYWKALFGFVFGNNQYTEAPGTVLQYSGWNGEILVSTHYYFIPASLRSVTITVQRVIPRLAFNNCAMITSITLPENATGIGECAFHSCTALETFSIPGTVTTVGHHAFQKCTSLPSVTLSGGLTAIEPFTFNGCTALSTVTISNTVTSIGNNAFDGCSSLKRFNSDTDGEMFLPTSCRTIGEYAFQNLPFITTIVVPDTVNRIENAAFKGCTSLANLTLPFVGTQADASQLTESNRWKRVFGFIFGNSNTDATSGYTKQDTYYYAIPDTIRSVTVTTQRNIPESAFENCNHITSITLPENATIIGSYAFNGCTSLSSFSIPASVTEIGLGAFWNCRALTSVIVPNGVTVIEPFAFCGCSELSAVTVPNSVTTIERNAFNGCSSLVRFNSDVDGELIVPTACETIGAGAFASLPLITKIVVPETVNSIGSSAFGGCTSLVEITLPFVGANVNDTDRFGFVFGYSVNPADGIDQDRYDSGRQKFVFSMIPGALRRVTITVQTNVPAKAFYNCDMLETVTLPANATIGTDAFRNCPAEILYAPPIA